MTALHLCVAPAVAGQSVTDNAAGIHARAVDEARAGNLGEALGLLRSLTREHPENRRYAFDHIAVASWAGQDHEALERASAIDLVDAPLYVVEAAARAARNLGRHDQAMGLYALVAGRAPERIDGFLGQAHTLIDQGKAVEALQALAQLRPRFDRRADFWEACARAHEARQEWVPMLEAAQRVLELSPTHASGLRSRANALRRLGAPHQVARVTPPSVLDADERAALKRAELGFAVRWGRVAADEPPPDRWRQAADDEPPPDRWRQLDDAIGAAQALAVDFAAQGRTRDAHLVEQDLLQALIDRKRMAEGVELYARLAAQGEQPPHVRLAAAAAYLQLRRPEQAYALYAAALPARDATMNDHLGFFYSMLESERHDEALAYIDRLSAETPEWLGAPDSPTRRPNPDYPRVQVNAALARAYTERLEQGQLRLDDLSRRAPADGGILDARTTTYRLRGWPRRAEDLALWHLAREPDDAWLRLGVFAADMAVADYAQAERHLVDAERLMDTPSQTASARRDWRVHNLRELYVEASWGSDRSPSTVTAAREHRIDAWLYTAPIGYRWRLFGHTQDARANFADDRIARAAAGVGAEYRVRDLRATAEVVAPGNRGTGLASSLGFAWNDHWRLDAGAEWRSLQTPLRAYREGVDADRVHAALSHRWHEARTASLGGEWMNFSDGNRRQALNASWRERVVSGPVYRLDARLEFYASENTRPANLVSYFNPSQDEAVQLNLENEWTQFRRYERALRHRLAVGLGTYRQAGFGEGGIGQLRYELIWSPDDRTELRLGTSFLRRPYDGVHSRLSGLHLISDWRF